MANVPPFSHLMPSSAKSFPTTTAPSWWRKLWLSLCIFCPTWHQMLRWFVDIQQVLMALVGWIELPRCVTTYVCNR